MILQRIAAGLKSRDWGTVVLEVLIVVVGIFIGLQVNDWNQRRLDRQLEQQFLQSLLAETIHNISEVEIRKFEIDGELASLKRVIALLEANAPDKISAADVYESFCDWYTVIPPGYRSTTYDELVSTGQINIIGDLALRQRLQLSESLRERYQRERAVFWDIRHVLMQGFRPLVHWQMDESKNDGSSCVANLEAMAGRRDQISGLVELATTQIVTSRFYALELEALNSVLEALLNRVETGDDA